jgi:hypothetical protein
MTAAVKGLEARPTLGENVSPSALKRNFEAYSKASKAGAGLAVLGMPY